jgi:hypothetical protein
MLTLILEVDDVAEWTLSRLVRNEPRLHPGLKRSPTPPPVEVIACDLVIVMGWEGGREEARCELFYLEYPLLYLAPLSDAFALLGYAEEAAQVEDISRRLWSARDHFYPLLLGRS